MVIEIRVRVKHNCPFLELANEFGSNISFGYCCRAFDILTLPGELTDELAKVAAEKFPNFYEWRISKVKEQITYIQMPCLCDSLYDISITNLIQSTGALIKYPISYNDGWEYYNLLAFDTTVQQSLLATLSEIESENVKFELLSNNDLGIKGFFKTQMLSVPEIFKNLTPHQINVLLKAFEGGYYEIPRNIRTKDIAEDMAVSRYAIDKVLRTAENSLINQLVPYLYFKKYLDSNIE